MSRFVRSSSLALVASMISFVSAGCFTPNIAADPKAPAGPGSAFSETSAVLCSSVRPQTEPDLMAWDPGSRANLSRLRQEGIVAVRYSAQGCNVELELLPECIGDGTKYAYHPYAETQTKVARNAQELYAELPIGAAHLSGKLAGERAIRTDYMLVGTASMPVATKIARSDLHGQGCERATHVVSSIYLGGFAMMAGQKSNIQAQASVFAGYSGGESGERLDSAGDPEACGKAAKTGDASAQCSVPLRIGLRALDNVAGVATGSSAPATVPSAAPVAPPPSRPETPAAEPDQDRDGISDREDACPTVPGVRSSNPSQNGCPLAPSSGPAAPAPDPRDLVGALKRSLRTSTSADGKSLLVPNAPIEFETGKTVLVASAEKALDDVAASMRAHPEVKSLSVEVHSDSTGDDKYNLRMTEERAKAVLAYLVKKGVEPGRLSYTGWGETKPVAPNTTVDGRAKNRRVELVLSK